MNNAQNKSIFKAKTNYDTESCTESVTDENLTYTILNERLLKNSIPESATKKRLENIPDRTTEWRWRFFLFGQRKLVEISYLMKNNIRIYVDYNGNEIEYNLDSEWDKYVIATYYAYVKN